MVAMATDSSHRLIMGNEEIYHFFFLIVDICIFLQKCLFSSPLRFIRLLSKSMNLIGCRGGKKGRFSCRIRTLVAMATYSFHKVFNGKSGN